MLQDSKEQSALLGRLRNIFTQSSIAYRDYLSGGKTFRFAKELKLQNGNALRILKDNQSSLPQELQEDIQALIIHYTEWTRKWEQLAAEKEYQPDDVFVFANDITFPKQAARNLEAAYEKLNPPAAGPSLPA